MIGLATPDITARISRPSRTPPPTVSIRSRSVVPIATSATPARTVSPLTVQTIVPGESSVPYSRNQSPPSATTHGTFANVSTLLARVGAAMWSAPAISMCAADELFAVTSAACSTISSTPRRYGGAIRGKGYRPSIVSSSAVSSP